MPVAAIMGLSLLCAAFSSAQDQNKPRTSIFDYKKELSLTDRQEKNLREIITKLQNYLTGKQKELEKVRGELNKLIMEKADLRKIKAKLENVARIQVEASYEDIASARAVEKELTPIQLTRWRAIQENFRKSLQQAQSTTPSAKK